MTKLKLDDLPKFFTPVMGFPHEGIRFWNVQDLTAVPGALTLVTDLLENHCRGLERHRLERIDYIAGFDARGFIFGALVAERLGIGFLQIRKKGKLPEPTVSYSYEKEYGHDTLQMNDVDLSRKSVVLIDDLLATGGTAEAGCRLIEMMGGSVAAFMAVTELPALAGRIRLHQYHCFSLMAEIDGILKTRVRYCSDAGIIDPLSAELVLIDRLSQPTGIAMVGGGVELYESHLETIIREVTEETGCSADPEQFVPCCVLAGADRDPRGDQVSIVYRVKTDTSGAKGEAGKTDIVRYQFGTSSLPQPEHFAFLDHRDALSSLIREAQEELA
jgi:adenine phosphoribosyltransferase